MGPVIGARKEGSGLVPACGKRLSSCKARVEVAALTQQRMLIPTAKVTRNNVRRGLWGSQVKPEKQAVACLAKNAFETKAVSPKCTGRGRSLKEKGQTKDWIQLLRS